MTWLFITIFIVCYVGNVILDLWLSRLNLRHLAKYDSVPPPFNEHIDNEKYEKSTEYTTVREKFSVVSTLITSLIFLTFIYTGLMDWVDRQLHSKIIADVTRGVSFFLVLYAFSHIMGIPFSLYSTFVIEERFGFNRQTTALWIKDEMKGILLSIIFLGGLSYGILYFMSYAGDLWWLYVWGLIFAFGVTLSKLFPVIIAPLFNKFTPLPEGELRETIDKLTKQLNFPLENVYVMDASTRSSHPNAYFAGFGKTKRLILYDSLVKDFTNDEIAAVVAHEIGHDRKHHIWKGLVFSQITSLLFFYCLSLLIYNPYLYKTFLITNHPSTYMGLILLGLVSSTALAYFSPLSNMLSWKFEREADRYSYEALENKEAIKTLLIKLSEKSLSNLTPHPLYARYYYSHPPVLQRLQYLGLDK